MSKFGMQVGDKEYTEIKDPALALELIEHVLGQFFGPIFLQYKPKCPLCNNDLSDFEKNMNKPVGECVHPECQSTIFNGDYFGKIKDIIDEWNYHKEDYKKQLKELKETANAPKVHKSVKSVIAKSVRTEVIPATTGATSTLTGGSNETESKNIPEITY